ncbi:uncharacterized protein CEXT_572091 [Caerostris extrusa]|uniref:Uncharacterized protein n=1 Tax=Caerostris extrusa TaxID=172846 RepID=A0AAV4Q218_CAEEX|nr:uncharacterized protein CEXT_572091 [Caerostris extrusa]
MNTRKTAQKRMDQRPFVSGSGTSNSNRDHHDKTTNGWYKREVENIEKDSIKSNSGKIRNDNDNDYVINDADGADSNGFGGENFWNYLRIVLYDDDEEKIQIILKAEANLLFKKGRTQLTIKFSRVDKDL